MTPADRNLKARLAAHDLHSRVDSREHTDPARRASVERFDNGLDPDRVLTKRRYTVAPSRPRRPISPDFNFDRPRPRDRWGGLVNCENSLRSVAAKPFSLVETAGREGDRGG